jgi:hypothetical protein
MTSTEILASAAALLVGALLGRLVDRSEFSFARAVQWASIHGDGRAFHGYLLAVSLLWILAAFAPRVFVLGVAPALVVGPVAAMLAGLVSGLTLRILDADPLLLAVGTGRLSLAAMVGLAGWGAGVVLGEHGPILQLFDWIRSAGPMEMREWNLGALVGLSPAILGVLLAAGVVAWLLRIPVLVRPGHMEWPVLAVWLAVLAYAGWGLAWLGGEGGVPNAVTAVGEAWRGMAEGRLWLRPSVLAGAGLVGYGVVRGLDGTHGLGGSGLTGVEALIRVSAGLLLGLASALAGGDPAAHAIFGVGRLALPSVMFVVAMWCGGWLMGLLEWRMQGRPGARPSLGHGV